MARFGTAIWTSNDAEAMAWMPRLMRMLVDCDVRFHFSYNKASGKKIIIPDLDAEEVRRLASSERIPLGSLYIDNTEI